MEVILQEYFSNSFYQLIYWALPANMVLGEYKKNTDNKSMLV